MSTSAYQPDPRRLAIVGAHSNILQQIPPAELGALNSRMCRESVLDTDNCNARMHADYLEEASKFGLLAAKVAPPHVLAEYVAAACANHAIVIPLEREAIRGDLEGVKSNLYYSAADAVLGQKRWPQKEVVGFLTRNPLRTSQLLVGCAYLSVALQSFMRELADSFGDGSLAVMFREFGNQLGSVNLTSKLPLALFNSLENRRGEAATIRDVDAEVCKDALVRLHDMGRFKIKLPTMGGPLDFRCPMEGYLRELFVDANVFAPIAHTMADLVEQSREFKLDGAMDQLPALIHVENSMTVVKELREVMLSKMWQLLDSRPQADDRSAEQ